MNVVVFVGPTLSAADAIAELDAVYLPPVSQGDVFRIARQNPRAIGIIDGYFERVPAVWHKEILWAMAEGVHVFGAASMGALRAAELSCFGMEGVGRIFEAYRDGVLTDDDEVAVAHGPAEDGFAVHSEPMANIRATLSAAETAGIIRPETGDTLERVAKECFYPERVYPFILSLAREQGAPLQELDAFAAWMPTGRVNQKRADAIEMLRRMNRFLAAEPAPKQVSFWLEHTLQWQRAVRFAGVVETEEVGGFRTTRLEALLDEVGLDGDAYPRSYQTALLSHLALSESRVNGYDVEQADVRRLHQYFCAANGLTGSGALGRWLQDNHLTAHRFESLLREEALRARLFEKLEVEVVSQLPDHLRLIGQYHRYQARAQHKHEVLERLGRSLPSSAELDPPAEVLLKWHFRRIDSATPEDLFNYARLHGFGSVDTLLNALHREYWFTRALEAEVGVPRC